MDALSTAQDSVGAGYAVAQGIGDKARQLGEQAAHTTDAGQAAQLKAQAGQLADGARQMTDAVGSSFSDAVAHTSLVGALILGVGTVLVAVLLPRKGHPETDAKTDAETGSEPGTGSGSTATRARVRRPARIPQHLPKPKPRMEPEPEPESMSRTAPESTSPSRRTRPPRRGARAADPVAPEPRPRAVVSYTVH